MRPIPLLVLVLALAGCSTNNPVARAAGSWDGGFVIESVGEKTDAASIKSMETRGTLALYATRMKYKLEMETAHEKFTVAGRWRAENGRVTLEDSTCAFTLPPEEEQKAFNLQLIQPDEVRALFNRPVVLDESADKRKLTGLKTSLGPLVGRFEFERALPR